MMSRAHQMQGNKRGPKAKFTPAEDAVLKDLVAQHGERNWKLIASNMVNRNARQCHDRWTFYLSPDVNHSPWTQEEEEKLVTLICKLGPHWVQIARFFAGRTDTQIKNKWNVIKRRMKADVPLSIPMSVSQGESDPIKQYMCVKEKTQKAVDAVERQKECGVKHTNECKTNAPSIEQKPEMPVFDLFDIEEDLFNFF